LRFSIYLVDPARHERVGAHDDAVVVVSDSFCCAIVIAEDDVGATVFVKPDGIGWNVASSSLTDQVQVVADVMSMDHGHGGDFS
jgi:hypothetical protein